MYEFCGYRLFKSEVITIRLKSIMKLIPTKYGKMYDKLKYVAIFGESNSFLSNLQEILTLSIVFQKKLKL